MIKKFWLILCLALIGMSANGSDNRQTDKILTQQNEFFGETVEKIFTYTNQRKHIYKILYYYDFQRKLIKEVAFLTELMAAEKGFYKMTTFYDGQRKRIRKELFYSDFLDFQSGFYKQVLYYDGKGNLLRTEVLDRYGTIIPQ